MGATLLWRLRMRPRAVAVLAAVVAVTGVWSASLLGRSPDWHPWLRTFVLLGALAGAILLLVVAGAAAVGAAGRGPGQLRGGTMAVLSLSIVAALAGPLGYSLNTASTAHTGAIPSAGPAVTTAGFGGGPGGFGQPGGFGPGGNGGAQPFTGNTPGNGTGQNGGGLGGPPGGGVGGGGGAGGLLDASTPSADLVALLKNGSSGYRWVAAAVGSNSAAGYQLASGEPVMAIGGFNGSDPSPTLAQFQEYVAEGKIHYFLGGGGLQANGGSQAAQEIASWVEENFTATTVGGTTVYDLSGGADGASGSSSEGATA